MAIKAVVFDLGGVIIDDPDFKNFWKDIKESKQLRDDFGTGKISIAELITKGSVMLGLNEQEFFAEYKKAYSGMKPIERMLTYFNNTRIPKYLLSDTNPVHAEVCKQNFPSIFSSCRAVYLSHETGLRKDNIKTFEFLTEQLQLKPEEIVFFDNKQEYVELASKLGIQAYQYTPELDLNGLKLD